LRNYRKIFSGTERVVLEERDSREEKKIDVTLERSEGTAPLHLRY
jgi:hypothetical protein